MGTKQLVVYLERRKTRQEAGRLTRDPTDGRYRFRYTRDYMKTRSAIPVGPELSLAHVEHSSQELFPSFQDRIPSRSNPAYAEYCEATGISVDEEDPIVLLGSIGHRGPSSFVFETIEEERYTAADLKRFRMDLRLTTREFAACFEVTQSSLSQVERGLESGSELLKRLRIYAEFSEVALDQLRRKGGVLMDSKRQAAIDYLKSRQGHVTT